MKIKITVVLIFFIGIETCIFSQTNLPKSYDFTWQYTLEVANKKESTKMIYFLAEEKPYYGFEIEDKTGKTPMGAMLMVFDKQLESTITFMSFGGQKMGQLMKMPNINENTDDNLQNYDFKEIGQKTILGYECQGVRMENDKYKMTMYFMLDAPVSFNNLYGFDSKTIPKGFNPKWLNEAETSLVMEMEFIDKKKAKNNYTRTCVGLQKKVFSINPGSYTFMKF